MDDKAVDPHPRFSAGLEAQLDSVSLHHPLQHGVQAEPSQALRQRARNLDNQELPQRPYRQGSELAANPLYDQVGLQLNQESIDSAKTPQEGLP